MGGTPSAVGPTMLFDGWDELGRVLVMGVLGYAGLIVILRITGKRTLAKMNAFDLVVTVSLGSVLAAAVLDENVSLAEAIAAFVVLCGLQFVIAWAAVRSERVRALVASEPALLAWEGRVLPDALKRERVAVEELRSVLRAAGRTSLDGVRAVVLETDGSFSVVGADEGDGAPRSGAGDPFLALDGVVAPKGLGPAHLRQR